MGHRLHTSYKGIGFTLHIHILHLVQLGQRVTRLEKVRGHTAVVEVTVHAAGVVMRVTVVSGVRGQAEVAGVTGEVKVAAGVAPATAPVAQVTPHATGVRQVK